MTECLTICDIAGYCSESCAWAMLAALTDSCTKVAPAPFICPQNILISDTSFALQNGSDSDFAYVAPECQSFSERSEASDVWSLGATVFYAIMGCKVMNGKGGRAQSPRSVLPYMRGSMPELSNLVRSCLAYNPSDRPTMSAIHSKAVSQYKIALEKAGSQPSKRHVPSDSAQVKCIDFWPEEMN